MKLCSRCNQSKEFSEYYKRANAADGLQSSCKTCMAESYKRSRNAKLDHYKEVQKTRNVANTARFKEWKEQQKCLCCGESETCCLDLHHLDPSEKEAELSNVASYWNWERMQAEIDKCVVVCSNCHRKIHAGVIKL